MSFHDTLKTSFQNLIDTAIKPINSDLAKISEWEKIGEKSGTADFDVCDITNDFHELLIVALVNGYHYSVKIPRYFLPSTNSDHVKFTYGSTKCEGFIRLYGNKIQSWYCSYGTTSNISHTIYVFKK